MDLLAFLLKSLTSLLGDPEHFGIVLLTVVISLFLFFNYRGLRKGLNVLADATANAPKAPDPKVYGEAMATKALELQQPTLDLWRENVALLTEDRERLKKELGDLREQFSQFKAQSGTDKKELTDRINALLATIETQNKDLQAKDAAIAERDLKLQELETLKGQVKDLTDQVNQLKAQLQMQDKLQHDLQVALERAANAEKERDDLKSKLESMTIERDALALRVQNQGAIIADLSKPLASVPPGGSPAHAEHSPADPKPAPTKPDEAAV